MQCQKSKIEERDNVGILFLNGHLDIGGTRWVC